MIDMHAAFDEMIDAYNKYANINVIGYDRFKSVVIGFCSNVTYNPYPEKKEEEKVETSSEEESF